MLSNISKEEMVERIRKMRVAANMSKDLSAQKRKTPVEVALVPSDQDEQTNLGHIFKRKRREAASAAEHSH